MASSHWSNLLSERFKLGFGKEIHFDNDHFTVRVLLYRAKSSIGSANFNRFVKDLNVKEDNYCEAGGQPRFVQLIPGRSVEPGRFLHDELGPGHGADDQQRVQQ
jgi:hypothetical protein